MLRLGQPLVSPHCRAHHKIAALPAGNVARRAAARRGGALGAARPPPTLARAAASGTQSAEPRAAPGPHNLPNGFDLGAAVAMAAAAFEAYLEPSGGAFKEVAINNTQTTYTCRSFLLDAYDGVLEVTVESAKGLKAVNLPVAGPGSDPYIVLSCCDSSGRTSVQWNTTQPVWGETFRLFIRDASRDVLRVRAYDKNKLLNDVELGVAMVAVAALRDGKEQQMEVELKGTNGQGVVSLRAQFLPFNDLSSPKKQQLVDEAVAASGPVLPSVSAAPPPVEAAAEGPAVGEAVEAASKTAVEAIEGAAGKIEEKLMAAGVDGKVVDALASVKLAAVERAKAAAGTVSSFVESQGISALPARDLTKILASMSTSYEGEAKQKEKELPEGGSGIALTPDQLPGAWKALAQVAGKALADVFEPVAFVENVDTDTQVWVSRSVAEREVVVAFRGTEQVKWKDFVSDINLIPQTLDAERTGAIDLNLGLGAIPVPMFKSFKKSSETMVHSGFLTAYDSVKNKVITLVDQITASASPSKPWRVYITGHSLGGAIATLCAYEISGRTPKTGPGSLEVSMYTFGAPRVGNSAFAEAFNSRLGNRSWRITNASDIVPTVPRLMGYSHVRSGVRLSPNSGSGGSSSSGGAAKGGTAVSVGGAAAGSGGFTLQFEDGSKDVLGEGREVGEVIADLASKAVKVAQGGLALEDVVDAIKEHEMALLYALMDGSALSQHMEDFYLKALGDALLALRPDLSAAVNDALTGGAEGASAGAGSA